MQINYILKIDKRDKDSTRLYLFSAIVELQNLQNSEGGGGEREGDLLQNNICELPYSAEYPLLLLFWYF